MKKLNFLSKVCGLARASQYCDVSVDRRLTVGSPSGSHRLSLYIAVMFLLLVVGAGNAWGFSGTFTKITSVDDFTDGYYVVVASESASSNANYAMGSYVTTSTAKNILGGAVSITSGTTITNPHDSVVYYITKSASGWTFKNVKTSKYLCMNPSATASNRMSFQTTSYLTVESATYSSSSPIGFCFQLKNHNASESTNRRFKYNAGSMFFSNYGDGTAYTTSMSPVRLFKLTSRFTVTFDAEGGTCATSSTQEATPGAGVELPSASPSGACSPEGWVFAGWAAAECTETTTMPTLYASGSTYHPVADCTLHAVYRKIESDNITKKDTIIVSSAINPRWSVGGRNNGAVTYPASGTESRTSIQLYNASEAGPCGYIETKNVYANISAVTLVATGNNANTDTLSYSTDGVSWTKWTNYCSVAKNTSAYSTNSFSMTSFPAGVYYLRITCSKTSHYIFSVEITSKVITYNSNPTCCTELGSINGSVSLTTDGCGAGELKATWKMTSTDGIASQTLKVYDENLDEVTAKRITGITASTSNQTKTISGLNPCKEYYVTVENVSSGGSYCAAGDPWASDAVTTLGYTYTVTKNNVSLKAGETEAARTCDDFLAEYVASDGYVLPGSITVEGASAYEWDGGVLAIDAADVTGNVTVTITGVAASNFENGSTVFVWAESSSAWNDNACVKAWFNNNGAGGAAQTTYWLYDGTGDNANKKLFATIVPASGDLNQVTLQRFASNCSDLWNNNGTVTKASDGGSNTFRTNGSGTSNVAWNGSGVTLYLYGAPNSWASSLATFADQGAGVWTATYSNYTPSATSADFKIFASYNDWIGNTGSNNNATLSGMIVGSTYNVTATLDVTDHSLVMSKTFVSGTVHFDMNGHGSAISDLTNVAANSKISAPSPAPTDAEYNFAGWYKEVGCTNAWNFASDQVTETMTLYAKWTAKPKNTITYSVPSCASVSPTSAQQYITQDAAIGTLPTPSSITGYTFYGWSLTEQTSETDAAPAIINSSYVPTGNTTLYAVYYRSTGAVKTTFTLVSDDEFVSGADYVIAANYSSADYAIKAAVKSSYYIDQTSVTVDDDVISSPNADNIWRITVEDALTNTVSLYNANQSKYLDIITSGSYKNLVLDASKKTFTMSSAKEDGYARTFGFQSTTTSGYYIHYNSSYSEFDASTSSSATTTPHIYLYKRAPNVFYTTAACKVLTPSISPATGTTLKPGSNTVTITCETASATIYYTTDGTTPSSSNGYTYSAPFTLNGAATVKAIAVKAGSDDSDVATVTYTWGKDFSLATSSYVPEEGDEIIIVNYNSGSPNKALSTTQNNNNRGQTSVTLNAGKIEVPDGGDVQVITLEDGENGNWLFNVGTNAYLYAAGNNNNNYLKTSTKAVAADNGIWTITIAASTSKATIKANGTNNPYLRYNGTNSLFSCYGSATTQDDIRLYYYRYPVSPKTLEPFEYAVGYGPSQVQAVTVKAYDLNGNITVTCPTNYELSTSPNSGFSTSNLTLTRDGSNTVNTKFYVRMAAGLAIGSYPGTMTISGGGMAAESRDLTGSVGAAPSGTNYTLVTDEEDIFPGDEIVILNASGTLLMSNKAGSNNYKAAQAPGNFTQMGATVFTSTSSDSIQNIVVEACDDEWLFKVGDNYLYAPSASNNQLKASTITYATNGNGQWKAEINHVTGEALVFAPNSANRDTMQFNGAVFSCYANAQYGYIKLYAKPSATANVCGSPSALTDFETTYGEGASDAQTFKVKARNITSGNVTVTAPTGYEVSKTSVSTGFAASQTLTPSDNKVAPTTLWVRLKADNEAGTYEGNIQISATGATTRTIALSGTVAPDPTITLDATSSTPLVTSRNGVNIMATNTLTLNIRGARAGQTVSISGTGLKFYKNDGTHYVDLSSTALTAPVTDQVIYVSYNPTSAGTGAVATPDITVTCDGGSETFSGKIKARNLPDAVAIVAKVNGIWQALPANISSASNPAPVQVSVATDGGVKKAYGAGTLAYKLWPVKTTNGSGDRFGTYSSPSALNAAMVRFAGNSDKGLWANDNKSTNTINNNAAITDVTSDVTTGYEWTITTTEVDGQFVYNLTSTHGLNTNDLRLYSNKWGTYGSSSGTNELYILPLVEVQDAALTVMEWSTNEIAVSYPNGGSVASSTFKAMIGEGDKTTVTATSLGGDMYKLTGVGNLQANPGKVLTLSMTESSIAKQAVFTIPLIVTAEKTEAELRSSIGGSAAEYNAIAKHTDVVIREGGKMTTGTSSGNFNDLYIYPGGQAVVSNDMSFGTVYMRGGYSFLNYADKEYGYPDLCVKSGTITTSGVKYDLYIDNRYYYTFAMPYDVTLASVTDETGSEDFPVWVKHYNGETRASGTHVSGWEWYGDEPGQSSFFAGIGYEITAKPRVSGRPVAIIRFPVKSGNITTDASREIGVSVSNYGYEDYGSGSLSANNVGWNFVGNPYLTEYKAGTASPGNANDTLMLVDQGYEKHIDETTGVWDGTYDWKSSNKRFITVPYDTQTDYHSEYVATYTIPAFSAFFIQTTSSGTFYMRGSRPQAAGVAPRFGQAAKEKPELHIDVLLSGEGESVEGKAGLLIHDKYEGGLKDFEDVEQWFVDQNEQKTYTFANGTALAYNLLNEQAATQVIPMGYIATVAGEHTYTINEANDVSGLAHLLLTDYETGLTTDLLVHDYVFTTEAGRFDERFAISAVFEQEEIVTEIAGTSSDSWTKAIGVYRDGNTLTLRGLPEGSSAYVYDMTGKLMASGENLHNVASFNIAAQGVYNIRVVSGDEAVTLRSILQ